MHRISGVQNNCKKLLGTTEGNTKDYIRKTSFIKGERNINIPYDLIILCLIFTQDK